MRRTDHPVRFRTAAQEHDSSLFVALELSKSIWLIAVSTPGSDKVSKYRVAAADGTTLLGLLARSDIVAGRCRSSRSTRPVLMGSGCTACWRRTAWRATWSMPRQSRWIGGALRRTGVDHVVIIGRDLLMQTFRSVRQEVAMLMHGAALHQRVGPHQAEWECQKLCVRDFCEARFLSPHIENEALTAPLPSCLAASLLSFPMV